MLEEGLELSSMGIRVDSAALDYQLKVTNSDLKETFLSIVQYLKMSFLIL